jgi:dihydroneopterin aldolase
MKKSTNTGARFLISGLELCVFLGWPEAERIDEQVVLLDIEITLPTPPEACATDELNDTVCYADIITEIHNRIGTRVFKLIEHLCYEIYQLIKPSLPIDAKLSIHLTKHPKIQGLTGGVCFSYEDEK